MEELPAEILRMVLRGCDLRVVRQVCSRLNQAASVLLLEERVSSLRASVARLRASLSERAGALVDAEQRGDEQQQRALADTLRGSELLESLDREAEALQQRMRDKTRAAAALQATATAAAKEDKTLLMRLCDLHPEFVCFAALRNRLVEEQQRQLQHEVQLQRQPRRDPHRQPAVGGRPDFPRPPRADPVLPRGFDPYGEPDPDHFAGPWGDDDRELPDYPGLYGPPGVNDPFGGGGGGLRDPRHDPLREPRRPPVNPDWDRDRFPMGYDPLRPGAGIPPFGAGGIGRPPQPAPPNPFNPRGGGSFGGPRFL